MQKGHHLQFDCISCKEPVRFSLFELEKAETPIACPQCKEEYSLQDDQLKRQLRLFEALCLQLVESQEVLGSSYVGVDIGDKKVKIPYKLLLTRLNSCIDLTIGDQPVSILFRLEPTVDLGKKQP